MHHLCGAMPLDIAILRNLQKQFKSIGSCNNALLCPRCRPDGDVVVVSFHDVKPLMRLSVVISRLIGSLDRTVSGI
jgi:hypothetical protein